MDGEALWSVPSPGTPKRKEVDGRTIEGKADEAG